MTIFFPIITSLTKFAQVDVNSFDIMLSGSSKLSIKWAMMMMRLCLGEKDVLHLRVLLAFQ